MPCTKPEHQGQHKWPESGELTVWPCERACAFCPSVVRDSSALRAHIRDTHCGQDKPGLTVRQGRKNPGSFDTLILNFVGTPSNGFQPIDRASPGGRPSRATNQLKKEPISVNEESAKPITRKAATEASAAQDPNVDEAKAQEPKVKETNPVPNPRRTKRKTDPVIPLAAPEPNSGPPAKRRRRTDMNHVPDTRTVPAATESASPPIRRGNRKRNRTSRALEIDDDDDEDVGTPASGAPVNQADVPELNHVGADVALQSMLESSRSTLRNNLSALLHLCEANGLSKQEIFDISMGQISEWVFKNDPGAA